MNTLDHKLDSCGGQIYKGLVFLTVQILWHTPQNWKDAIKEKVQENNEDISSSKVFVNMKSAFAANLRNWMYNIYGQDVNYLLADQ